MRPFQFAVLGLVLSACSFSGSSSSPDAAPRDGGQDGPLPPSPRRIRLTIPSSSVTAPLVNFPVYVEVTNADLKLRLDADASLLSFHLADGAPLDHDLQGYDPDAGTLGAWVRIPALAAATETRFELRYGTEAVMAAPNPAGVWSNDFDLVFHLEENPVNDLPVLRNAATAANPGIPRTLEAVDRIVGQLGRGLDFDDGMERVEFTNPLTAGAPSTISMWVKDEPAFGDEGLIFLGTQGPLQARWMFSSLNSNRGSVGLINDDFTKPDVVFGTWTLLHWTYEGLTSRVYANGEEAPSSPFTHTAAAMTGGTTGILGNMPIGFGTNPGLNGALDEVHISHVVRDAAWIAAEYANQRAPATFVVASAPEPLP
ncbi:MAG: LamG-like jellyroll fold domain-containing protein [Kofleriaceae bacterium]